MAHAIFRLLPQRDRSFSVSLKTARGRLKIIPGFDSEHEARAWIVQTQRMFHEFTVDPRLAPIRDILARKRHNDGCGGRAGRVELLTGIEGVSSHPVRRIVLL